ncbi:hypothetical protein JCM33374_g3764 [Metschnikowia sp. JCM 33374]|nr:hypothetical protein JCM33374_g3764 [Metschnikowia sp. JCM 33374]
MEMASAGATDADKPQVQGTIGVNFDPNPVIGLRSSEQITVLCLRRPWMIIQWMSNRIHLTKQTRHNKRNGQVTSTPLIDDEQIYNGQS